MTQTERAALLRDALAVWGVTAKVEAEGEALLINRDGDVFTVTTGPAPTRWFLRTPAGRTRPAPSVVALLEALRRALGVAEGASLVVGGGASLSGQ